MEKLLELIHKSPVRKDLYIIWTARNRICHIRMKRANDHHHYSVRYVDRLYIPFIVSWYKTGYYQTQMKRVQYKTIPHKSYLEFDGHRLSDWSPKYSFRLFKNTNLLKDLKSCMNNPEFMESWIYKSQTRFKMMYKTLVFLADSGINPSQLITAESGFTESIKKKTIQKARSLQSKIIIYKGNHISLVKDVLGLWTVDQPTKTQFLDKVSCINTFDIEHIVSNSYGADNTGIEYLK